MTGIKRMIRKIFAAKKEVDIEDAVGEIAARMTQLSIEAIIISDKKGVISTSQVNNFYRRICAKAGIEFHGQHSLRHTFATRCIEAGVKPVVLKNWLDHTNIHITLDTYADVFGSLNSASMETLEKYLNVK
jgi:integrase